MKVLRLVQGKLTLLDHTRLPRMQEKLTLLSHMVTFPFTRMKKKLTLLTNIVSLSFTPVQEKLSLPCARSHSYLGRGHNKHFWPTLPDSHLRWMQKVNTSAPRGLTDTLIHDGCRRSEHFWVFIHGIVVRADFVLFYLFLYCIVSTIFDSYSIKQTKDYKIDICCKQGNKVETGWLEIRLCPNEVTFMHRERCFSVLAPEKSY
jgi:hypothetical protein